MQRVIETDIRYVPPSSPELSESDYEGRCCVAGGPIQCETTHRPFYGYSRQEILDKLGYSGGVDENGVPITVRFIGGNPSGVCGEEETQLIGSESCCDEIPPMEYDTESSADIIADDTSGVVHVTGGKAPYNWEISGTGFSIEAVTQSANATVTTTDACGSGVITVTDACDNVASGVVRSPEGVWFQVYHSQAGINGDDLDPNPPYADGCPKIEVATSQATGSIDSTVEEYIHNGKKVVQYFLQDRTSAPPAKDSLAEAIAYCETINAIDYVQDPKRLEGSCFDWESDDWKSCSDYSGTTLYPPRGYDLGKYSNVWETGDPAYYYPHTYVAQVTGTDIYEWRCV